MAKNIVITIDTQSNAVKVNTETIGAVGENLQGQFIVEFKGTDYIGGVCWLEIKSGKEKNYIELTPSEKVYMAPIKSGITKYQGVIKAQIRITQAGVDGENPIFKSETFSLNTLESINALEDEKIPEEYPTWIESANAKLAELEEAISRVEASGGKTYIKEITGADFTQVGSTKKYCVSIKKSEHGLTNPFVEKAILLSLTDTEETEKINTPVIIGERTLSTGTVKVYVATNFIEQYYGYILKIYLKGE